MEDKVVTGLLKAEKLVQKIKKKVKRNDLDYTIQAVVESINIGEVKYAVRITPINESVGPMVFVADSVKELNEKLQYRLDNGLDADDIEINYHESMLKNLSNTFDFHKMRIEQINKLKEEEKK